MRAQPPCGGLPAVLLAACFAAACGSKGLDDPEAIAGEDGVYSDDGFGPEGGDDPGPGGGKEDSACTAATSQRWEFLHDACRRKKQPTYRARDWTCPAVASTTTPLPAGSSRRVTYRRASEPIVVDSTALASLVPPELKVTVILVQRVNGVPYYRYLSNGTANDAFQPWSSSKFLAAANAGAQLRARSNGKVGLTASTQRGTPLGDLVTVIHSYVETRFTSNGCARYFHDIGGRANAHALVHAAWLRRPDPESFGGNYGMPAPALGYTFVEADGSRLVVAPDTLSGIPNHLSTLTMAEALKRLVMHREDAATRLPGIQWKDLAVLFQGPERSVLFPDRAGAGGMMADRAIYVQAAVDLAQVEQRSQGRWRIYGKLGNGNGELVENAYACFPVLGAAGAPQLDQGREFFISARLASGGASWRARDALFAGHFKTIIARIMDGRLR